MSWRVDSYFINVGLGDGAIHILFNEATKQIHKSILIDGGLFSGATQVKHAITKLEDNYGMKDTTRLVFDAVVVTHWDEDHFQGTMEMLRQGCYGLPAKSRCTHVLNKKTTFYCPEKSRTNAKDSLYVFKKDDNDEEWVGIREEEGSDNITTLCKVVSGKACLGIDFFTGVKFEGDIPAALKKHFEKENKMKKEEKNRPVMLCLGADLIRIDGDLMDKGRTTPKNASSLMTTLMMWDYATQRPRVHLYTGGDAEEWQEDAMLEWLTDNIHKDIKIDAIKAGHHGSHFATTTAFFDHGIEWLVYSAAEDYGHPGRKNSRFGMLHPSIG